MGQCLSKDPAARTALPQENDETSSKGFSRLKKTSDRNSKGQHIIKEEHFSGIARIELIQAKMQFKDKWFACVSIGEQTFRTANSKNTDKPVWKSEKKVVLEKNGPRIVRVSVFETNLVPQNNLVGYCELNLSDIFDSAVKHEREVHDLYDPNIKSKIVGRITLSYSAEDREAIEKAFACRLLSLMDFDESGELSLPEFSELVKAFGNKISDRELEELFVRADRNGDGKVSADELATLLAVHSERTICMKRCPVCGEELGIGDGLNDMIHLSLCFDEGTGKQIMMGGFLTEKQASSGWMFKLSEWASLSTYDVGLKAGANAAHILVFDRRTKRIVEEVIDIKIVLAMRAIYQSKLGLALLDAGTKNMLISISDRQGERMNSVESAADIPGFIEFFKDRIDIDEFKYPLEHYKTFNEFFIRELRLGARPIEHPYNDGVAICAADCRLMVFTNTDDATRFWIKGRKFSIPGLLGNESLASDFEKGSLAIFRLAPQDYHRFHAPVTGKLGDIVDIPGHLYTVNPIAVNSKYCNVFTENKRTVCVISTYEFGKVAFVAIGATMVGSITFTKKQGDRVRKGDELGYFSFGGSTCICLFQQKAIEFDEDLLANSERSLETVVSMGMTLGVSKALSYDTEFERPTQTDSVVGMNNDVSRRGITATNSLNVRAGHLGLEGLPDDFVETSYNTGSFASPGSSTTSSHGRGSQGRSSQGRNIDSPPTESLGVSGWVPVKVVVPFPSVPELDKASDVSGKKASSNGTLRARNHEQEVWIILQLTYICHTHTSRAIYHCGC